ncbi:MAG: methionine ABC transporter ATP-binding protein MetN [Prevotella sp.]|jgi:D-methionine transport system ATP-binding protein|nr:methionine ABC transporter ATP-binding protein MetN [Prevotella sp.]MDR2001444.1 methionine ABC transporter ATP-binding protein MetN [Prevotella sp.]
MIELRNITKDFSNKGTTSAALSNVSLIIPEGKIYGVIGESGAGKSTLIRCVNLLERPTSGEVYIDGQNMTALSPSALAVTRRNIGMIFQHFNLLSSATVFENVAFPLKLGKMSKDAIKKRVLELLNLVGLEDKTDDYPAKLSGGQKQRVAIARALANNPKILLCDEATSALDPATTYSILSLLKDINKKMNITILLITHEMEVVKTICDEVAILNKGKLIEHGTIAVIFSHPKHELTKYFIDSSVKVHIPSNYVDKLAEGFSEGKHMLIKLEISGQSEANAVLSDIAKSYGVNSNIVCAQMDHIGGVKFGVMLVEFNGQPGKEAIAVQYLIKKNIKVNILGYV